MHSFVLILLVFIAWKTLLLFLVWLAPGIGYDTSTTLLSSNSKLLRWDAIYYVQTARRGHKFEQEWAFGKGVSTLISWTSEFDIDASVFAGSAIAHISHFLSVMFLWGIVDRLNKASSNDTKHRSAPLIAALLHIISPAGAFLSAPYGESPFSCLNMLGCWLYLQAQTTNEKNRLVQKCSLLIAAGLSFGCATFIRSNGLFSGLLFLFDAITLAWEILKNVQRATISLAQIASLIATVMAGLCVATGLLLPQYLAYDEYCTTQDVVRPWCSSQMPLIYSFVQSHYWGVGFLRYWTLSNLPLFCLAAPVLGLLIKSSLDVFLSPDAVQGGKIEALFIRRLAAPQFVLAILAITTYHVQIITRLASGYPWHYIWLSEKILSKSKVSQFAVKFFVMYALIQAGLFASFLPPA